MRQMLVAAALSVGIAAFALGDETAAGDPWQALAAGDAALAAEDYAAALEHYTVAAEDERLAAAPELLHNRALAHFRRGELDEARALWTRAAPLKDAAFEARMRHNLGVLNQRSATDRATAGDVAGALDVLERAIAQYRDAVRLDPGFDDPRANLELAARERRALREQQQQQEQQQQDQQQDQQGQPTGEDGAGTDEQPNPPQDPASGAEPSDAAESAEDQSPSSEQQAAPDSEPPPGAGNQQAQPQDAGTPPSDDSPQAQPQQPGAEQPASENASDPTDAPSPAAADQPPGAEARDGDAPTVDGQPLSPSLLSKQQIERLLQLIARQDRARRELLRERQRLEAARAAENRPVERDW